MTKEVLARLVRTTPANNVGWFDVLDKRDSFARWLRSKELKDVDYAVWLFGQDAILRERGERVATMLGSAIEEARSAADTQTRMGHLLRLFDFADFALSRPVFDLFLALFRRGDLDDRTRSEFQFYSLPKKNVAAALDLLVAAIDRHVLGAAEEAQRDIDEAFSRIRLPEGFISETAAGAPEAFVRAVFPRVLRLIKETECVGEDGEVSDNTWPWLTLAYVHDHKASLLDGLSNAMGKLAKLSPEKLNEYVGNADQLPHRNLAYLLLSSWSANPQQYGDKIVDYLLFDSHRLNLGYGMWTTGNGIAAISRGAIASATKFCSDERLRRLEQAILDYCPPIEREDPKRLGYTQALLLHAIEETRLESGARKRLRELERKFPGMNVALPGPSEGAFVVESPIPAEAAKKMNDDQWVSAMREYATDGRRRIAEDFRKGGASELARQLEAEARLHKERFAALAIKLGPDIPRVYFDALIRGLVARGDESGSAADKASPPLPELSSDLLLPVIRHIHELPGHPCGRWLCSSIGKIAKRELPEDIYEIVGFYAVNGEDPNEAGQREKTYFGGDLVTYGINTTRGAAADAVGDLLLANQNRWPLLERAVRALAADQSWSVRAVSIYCLTALLSIDRSLAVELFLNIATESPAVLSSMFVERFLYYAVFSHYTQLRDVLLRMIDDRDQAAREAAARAITVASFRFAEAEPDVARVRAGDEVCRAALATIAAGNLQFPELSERCRTYLIAAFNDDSKKVHDAAVRCFHEISDEQLSQEEQLIDAFLESPAFRDNAHTLLVLLEESVHRLPDIVCKIPERAVAIHRNENSEEAMEARWWTHQMATLVLRLYEQTSDPAIRTRCLNILDDMIELDFGNITTELSKLERA